MYQSPLTKQEFHLGFPGQQAVITFVIPVIIVLMSR
jgi:hypothetical protein